MSSGLRLRQSVVEAKQRLAAGREKLKNRHAAGAPGIQICGAMSDLYDEILLELYADALADLRAEGVVEDLEKQIALVPHGGYGRRDIAPYSDVDLMILHLPGAGQQVGRLAERLLRDVFDAGLQLGLSVRTTGQACKLSAGDARICTSLIESRYLAGSVSLYSRYASRFQQYIQRRQRPLFAAIEKARLEERSQYGETVYLLEPHLKRSRGGLRDLQLLRWIGFVSYGAAEPESLRLRGHLAPQDFRVFRRATDFLLGLRNEMHFHAGKANDSLDRAEQMRLAAVLGFTGDDGLLPVEQFMRDYFRHTDQASSVVNRFLETARPGSRVSRWLSRLASHQMEGDFLIQPGYISATSRGLAKLRTSLTQVLRLVDLANLYDKSIDHATCEEIRLALPEMNKELTPRGIRHFLSILDEPARLGEGLYTLHEMGVLEHVIPEFSHARSLLQFNEYHKYTVDEHSLRAVSAAAGFLNDTGLLGAVYRSIQPKRLLHLALLIHDLGKGHPQDHSELGREIAQRTAERLGFSDEETRILMFLVHKHLMMSHLAFRRDTSDQQLLNKFAHDVGSPNVLKMLFVLTAADLTAVGPDVWNDWKAQVLGSLYGRTMERLSGDATGAISQEQLRQRREQLRGYFKAEADSQWYFRLIETLPAALLYSNSPAEIAAELRQMQSLAPREVRAAARYRPEEGTVEYTISTYEDVSSGIFHKLTGGLAAAGLEILSAEIHTLANRLVFDRFVVTDPDYQGEPPQDRLETVCRQLVASLESGQNEAPRFRRVFRPGRSRSTAELAPRPTQVRADNRSSAQFTILDVFAVNRQGLLYTIAKTLSELGLSVSVARIGTYLDQVVDVFYVTDANGDKIEDEQRLNEVRDRLLSAIDTLNEQSK